MSRAYAGIWVVVACGLVSAVGCYTESTIDQVNQLPAEGSAKPKRGAKVASQPGPGPKPARPVGAQQSKAQKVARQTEQYRQRVKGDQAPRATTEAGTARPTTLAARQPGESKRAGHVASDSFEAGKAQPMAVASIDTDVPSDRSSQKPPPKPRSPEPGRQKPPPQSVSPKPPSAAETRAAPTPTASPPLPIARPKTDATAKARVARPSRPIEAPKPKPPQPPAGEQTPSPARPSPAKPTVTPAPTTQAKTSADKTSGFIVPRPPAIPKMSAKGVGQKPAKGPTAPPAKPTVAVKVPSAPKTIAERKAPARPNRPVRTHPPAKEGIKAVIDQKLKEVAANPNDLEKQMALRFCYLADKQPKNARSEIPGTKPQIQAIIDKLMDVNITALQGQGRDAAVAATKLLADVEKLREVLTPHADLKIPTVKLCTNVDRFSVYDEIDPPQFQSGKRNLAIVYCEVKNFTWVPTEDSQWRALLGERIKVLNPKGETIYQTPDEDVPYTNRQRLEDFYLGRVVELPRGLRPGKYILRVYVEDKLAGKASENQIDFRMTK